MRKEPFDRKRVSLISPARLPGCADALRENTPSVDITGPATRRDYYVVRVRLDEEDVRRRVKGFQLTPGMPADVYIQTGERTFFEYIMRPVLDSFSHAFRES